jgi:mannose-6-phosphate isomerase
VRPLRSSIRPYAWGSHTAIARLQGRPVPSAGPEAELWLGAHPSAPSQLPTGSLAAAIEAEPDTLLGPAVAARFGARLPYLLKVLAAAEPLSLQVHPDSAQAAAGFAAEQAGGTGAAGNYVDPFHKPELLVALEPFDALCGFRDPEQSYRALAALRVPVLDPVLRALNSGSVPQRLQAAVETLVTWPAADRAELVATVAGTGDALAGELAKRYPGDVGVVLALLLNRVRLGVDDAVFMPSGNLHGYLSGVGIEVMAASDNVVRAGLTPKRVDQVELLRLLRFEVLADPVVPAVPVAAGVLSWPVPVPDFVLHKATASSSAVAVPGGGPRVVVCVHGSGVLRVGAESQPISSGAAVFLGADEPSLTLVPAGSGLTVFQASCG